jgi:hypothetical protein
MALYSVTVDLYSTDQPVCTQVAISATSAGADWDQIMNAIETALHEQFDSDDLAHFEVQGSVI